MGSSMDQLYLLEVLVERIHIPKNENVDISVKVVFGDVGTFVISHDSTQQQRSETVLERPSRIEFSTGKSLLFPMRPASLLSEFDASPLAIYVAYKNENLGFTVIQWDQSFYHTAEQSRIDNSGTIPPNLLRKSFILKHPIVNDVEIGSIVLVIRLSCLGTKLMTKFQLAPGINERHSSSASKCDNGSIVSSNRMRTNSLSNSTDAVPVPPVYSDISDLDAIQEDTSRGENAERSVQDELPIQSAVANNVSEVDDSINIAEMLNEATDKVSIKKIKGPCGNSECPIAVKIKKFLDSNPVGFEPESIFKGSPLDISKKDAEEFHSSKNSPLTHKSFTSELTDINNLFPFPPTRKYEPLTYFAQKCYGNCPPDLSKKGMEHKPFCPARKHAPSCALSVKDSLDKLCPQCGGYTESGKTCLEHTMEDSMKVSPDFKPKKTVEENVQQVYKCELPSKTTPVKNCHVNRLPGWLFSCQGGGCKNIIKKMDCQGTSQSTPKEPCFPVPHCMQQTFNPCERPKCLKEIPRSHFPCFVPPCLSSQVNKKKSKKSKRKRTRSSPENSSGSPDSSSKKRKKKRKKCDTTCPVRMKLFYERINLKAHRNCLEEENQRIPANMGWRWNGHPDFLDKVKNGWRPGAVPKQVYDIMSKFKSTNRENPEEVAARFKDKKQKAMQAAESHATLQVSRKDNTVTVNFLTLPPELNAAGLSLSEFNPLTFKIMEDGRLERISSVLQKSVLRKNNLDLDDTDVDNYFNINAAIEDISNLLKKSNIIEPFKTLDETKTCTDIELVREGSMKELKECKSVYDMREMQKSKREKSPVQLTLNIDSRLCNRDSYLKENAQSPQKTHTSLTNVKSSHEGRVTDIVPGTSGVHMKKQRTTNSGQAKDTMDNRAKQTKPVKK